MATYLTARQFGEQVGLEHLEVIRRIRRNEIHARKLGWNWVIKVSEVDRVKSADWYKRVMARRAAHKAAQAAP